MAKGYKTGGRIAVSNEQRFWSHVLTSDGCWGWNGYHDRKGYAKFGIRPDSGGSKYKIVLAIDYAYQLLIGPIPTGKVLDHKECDNKRCINPGHLEPESNRTNVLRGVGPSAINTRKTHCIHGHEFSEKNTYIRKDAPYGFNGRKCRICMRLQNARLQGR
jgi:hypothetical protein